MVALSQRPAGPIDRSTVTRPPTPPKWGKTIKAFKQSNKQTNSHRDGLDAMGLDSLKVRARGRTSERKREVRERESKRCGRVWNRPTPEFRTKLNKSHSAERWCGPAWTTTTHIVLGPPPPPRCAPTHHPVASSHVVSKGGLVRSAPPRAGQAAHRAQVLEGQRTRRLRLLPWLSLRLGRCRHAHARPLHRLRRPRLCLRPHRPRQAVQVEQDKGRFDGRPVDVSRIRIPGSHRPHHSKGRRPLNFASSPHPQRSFLRWTLELESEREVVYQPGDLAALALADERGAAEDGAFADMDRMGTVLLEELFEILERFWMIERDVVELQFDALAVFLTLCRLLEHDGPCLLQGLADALGIVFAGPVRLIPDVLARLERTIENGSDLPRVGGEVGVATAEGEVVGGVAAGGDDTEVFGRRRMGKDEIRDESTQDDRLLDVLLSKVGAVGLDDVKELGDDGGDAAEEGGAAAAFHLMAEAFDLDKGADLIGNDLGEAVRVLGGSKLGRIDKDGDDGIVVLTQTGPDELEMAVVERAHGGHEADRLAVLGGLQPPCSVVADGSQDGDGRFDVGRTSRRRDPTRARTHRRRSQARRSRRERHEGAWRFGREGASPGHRDCRPHRDGARRGHA
ncbi:hypothetical protein L1887_60209 [Cichorium endivia]|nr:hypothetical protein L1887_60209 [Cichorium endivia]